jgi:hypothetical protein
LGAAKFKLGLAKHPEWANFIQENPQFAKMPGVPKHYDDYTNAVTPAFQAYLEKKGQLAAPGTGAEPTLAGDLKRQSTTGVVAQSSALGPRRRKQFPLAVNGYTGAFGDAAAGSKTLLGT